MESAIYNYSQFFNDDGGFDKVRSDFDKLGDDLIKKAKEIQSKIQLFSADDVDSLKKYEDQTEDLIKVFKKYGDAKESINKVEQAYLEAQKKNNKSNEEQIDNLVSLDQELAKYKSQLAEVNTFAKNNIKTDRDLNKERVNAELQIKKVRKAIQGQQKEILEMNKLTRKEQKLLKAKIVLEKEEVKTLDDVRERMSALRTVVQSLDLKEQAGEIKIFNDEIDELTDLLSDNSDEFIKNKINIGNYEEAITNALKSSSLFTTNIGVLDNALGKVTDAMFATREELELMEKSLLTNTNALKKMTVSFGKLNKTLKASIIGVVLIAIAALGSAFGNTRAGTIRLEKAMASFNSVLATTGQTAKAVFVGISSSFAILIKEFKGRSFADLLKDAFTGDLQSDLFVGISSAIAKTFDDISGIVSSGAGAIVKGLENIDNAFKLGDQVSRLNQEIAKLNGQLAVTQSIADDSTRSLSTQLFANSRALELSEEIATRQLEISRAELELANEKVKQNVLANGVEANNLDLSQKGEAFAEATLNLAQRRGSQLEISNELIDAQQQALLEVINVENDLALTKEENAKKSREINRDIFEQNLDLLIDLIDTEKNLSEQLVNDTTKNFKRRVQEFNRFLIVFRLNAQKELDEFTKNASNNGLDLDFQVDFNDDGSFELFINNQQLSIDNIVELNEQLQGLGIDEITINRFREFIIESRNGVRDFKDLNKELTLVGFKVKELKEDIVITERELKDLDELTNKVKELQAQSNGDISPGERRKIVDQLIALEKEKTDIAEFANFQRLFNRRDAIDAELSTVEEGSEREKELLLERLAIEKKIREGDIDARLKETKESNKRIAEEQQKFADEMRRILDLILDRVLEIARARTESAEDEVDVQKTKIDKQQELAQRGLSNTLAFEQRELRKREAELIKRQKQEQRLEKIKAVYASYSNYASRGEDNALLKALKDFAILEAVTASFKDGGITGVDGVKTNQNGITLGARHNANGTGGNLAWHEKGEGFFNRQEVENMGQDNFRIIKSMAGAGQIDSDFISGQRQAMIKVVPVDTTNQALISEVKDMKKAIMNQPHESLRVPEVVDGILRFQHETSRNGRVTRNTYIVKKSKF